MSRLRSVSLSIYSPSSALIWLRTATASSCVLVCFRWKVPLWEFDRYRDCCVKDISFLILIWIKSLQLKSARAGLWQLYNFNEFATEFAIIAVLVEAAVLVDAAKGMVQQD